MAEGGPEEPATRPIAVKREGTRGLLAFATLGLLAATVLLALALVGSGRVTVDDMLRLLQPILPAEVGLAGSATAFYFGGRPRA